MEWKRISYRWFGLNVKEPTDKKWRKLKKDKFDEALILLKEALRCHNNDLESRGLCIGCRERIGEFLKTFNMHPQEMIRKN